MREDHPADQNTTMVRRPLISVLHPTARVSESKEFPRGWRDVHDAYLALCSHPERVEYIIVVHEWRCDAFYGSEPWQGLYPRAASWGGFRVLVNTGRDCVVDQLNCGARAASGDIITATMDDMYPPQRWDALICESICGPENHGEFPGIDALDKEVVAVYSSGATPDRDRALMIAGAVTKTRLDRIGFLLDRDFESMFADNWYAVCAKRDELAGACSIIERLDIRFEHRHPSFGTQTMDAVYELQNRQEAYTAGIATFVKKLLAVISSCP